MRKILVVLGILYFMALGQVCWGSWQSYQLSLDAQPISGKVIACEQDPPVADSVIARYEFEVGGRRYSNTFETTPVPVGRTVELYYSPSHPELNSADRPEFTLQRASADAVSLTVAFAFWAALLSGVAWLRRVR